MTTPPAAGTAPSTPLPPPTTNQPVATGDSLPTVGPEDPELARPLPPIGSFDTTPLETAVTANPDTPEVR